MPDAHDPEDKYVRFISIVRAVESNRESLQAIKKVPGYSRDTEQHYLNVIKAQERLLKEILLP